jgi:Tfp pilus assembly protein PilN
MINLLPPEEKNILIQEERFKLILILGIVFLSALLSLILILFSIRIYISSQTDSEKTIFIQEEEKVKTAGFQELQEKITLANKNLSNLNSFYQNQIYFTEILEIISGTLPSGTYLSNLSLKPLGGGVLDCNLSGFAPTREVLLDFKKNLETEKTIKEIYFPPANWVESKDIDFNITFKITK